MISYGNQDVVSPGKFSKARYQKWIEAAYYYKKYSDRLDVLEKITREIIENGPLAAFSYLSYLLDKAPTKQKSSLKRYYLTFWRRMILILIDSFRTIQPCQDLYHLHRWIKENPQAIDWSVRYNGICVESLLFELETLTNDCSEIQCKNTGGVIKGIKSKGKCRQVSSCWKESGKECFQPRRFEFVPFYIEGKLFRRAKRGRVVARKMKTWLRWTVDDALMRKRSPRDKSPVFVPGSSDGKPPPPFPHGQTRLKKPRDYSLDEGTKESRDTKHAKIKPAAAHKVVMERIKLLEGFSNRMIRVVTKIGYVTSQEEKKRLKNYSKVIGKVESLNKALVRCQIVHGKRTSDVLGCLDETGDEVEAVGREVEKIEREIQSIKVSPKSKLTTWSFKWMIAQIIALLTGILRGLAAPYVWLFNKAADYTTRLYNWVWKNVVETVLLVMVILGVTYGAISLGFAGVLLGLLSKTFWIMWGVFVWWCNLTWLRRLIFMVSMMGLDILVRRYTKKNAKILRSLTRINQFIMFSLQLLSPLCVVYKMFGETISNAYKRWTSKPLTPPTYTDNPPPPPPPGGVTKPPPPQGHYSQPPPRGHYSEVPSQGHYSQPPPPSSVGGVTKPPPQGHYSPPPQGHYSEVPPQGHYSQPLPQGHYSEPPVKVPTKPRLKAPRGAFRKSLKRYQVPEVPLKHPTQTLNITSQGICDIRDKPIFDWSKLEPKVTKIDNTLHDPPPLQSPLPDHRHTNATCLIDNAEKGNIPVAKGETLGKVKSVLAGVKETRSDGLPYPFNLGTREAQSFEGKCGWTDKPPDIKNLDDLIAAVTDLLTATKPDGIFAYVWEQLINLGGHSESALGKATDNFLGEPIHKLKGAAHSSASAIIGYTYIVEAISDAVGKPSLSKITMMAGMNTIISSLAALPTGQLDNVIASIPSASVGEFIREAVTQFVTTTVSTAI